MNDWSPRQKAQRQAAASRGQKGDDRVVSKELVIGLGVLFALISGTASMSQTVSGERIVDARPGDVRVLATAAIRIPLEAVRAEASKAIGHPLVIEYESARGNLKDAIVAGAGFEVAVLLPDVDEALLKSG